MSNVIMEKYGKFFRAKKLSYVIFDFKNNKFGELFKQANREILFGRVLSELEAKGK